MIYCPHNKEMGKCRKCGPQTLSPVQTAASYKELRRKGYEFFRREIMVHAEHGNKPEGAQKALARKATNLWLAEHYPGAKRLTAIEAMSFERQLTRS